MAGTCSPAVDRMYVTAMLGPATLAMADDCIQTNEVGCSITHGTAATTLAGMNQRLFPIRTSSRTFHITPPPLAQITANFQKVAGATPRVIWTKTLSTRAAPSEDTSSERKGYIIDVEKFMPVEAHAVLLPEIDTTTIGTTFMKDNHPQPQKHRKIWTVTQNQKMESKFNSYKGCRNNQPIKVLHAAHTSVSVQAGQGQATVPPPYAFPFVYTSRGKNPHQGLRLPPRWLSRGPCQGPPVLPSKRRRNNALRCLDMGVVCAKAITPYNHMLNGTVGLREHL